MIHRLPRRVAFAPEKFPEWNLFLNFLLEPIVIGL